MACPQTPVKCRRLEAALSDPKTPMVKSELPQCLKRSLPCDSVHATKRPRTDVDQEALAQPSRHDSDASVETTDIAAALLSSHDAATSAWPLAGRERECGVLDGFLSKRLRGEGAREGCLYMSGGPGTGKTLSTRAASKRFPHAAYFEVNCMDLKQRSVDGLLSQLAKDCMARTGPSQTAASPHKALVESLRQLNSPAIIVVDEVDQLVKRGARAGSHGALNDLLGLPQHAGLETVAVVMIANAVDLLDRTGIPLLRDGTRGCSSLLFEPYTADQLRQIVKARLSDTEVERAMLEVRVRQVAKSSGDCRQALSICEEAIQKAEAGDGKAVKLGMKSSKTNPLSAVQSLPVEQQVLLSALTGSKSEAAMRVPAVCSLYKDMCRKLRQPVSLASKGHVSNVLSLLEQRGLLSMRTMKVKVGKGKTGPAETVVELAVARDQVRQRLPAFLQLQ